MGIRDCMLAAMEELHAETLDAPPGVKAYIPNLVSKSWRAIQCAFHRPAEPLPSQSYLIQLGLSYLTSATM